MSVKFGDVDINQVIENEYRIGVLESLIELLMQRVAPGVITQKDLIQVRQQTIQKLKEKYPNTVIGLRESA